MTSSVNVRPTALREHHQSIDNDIEMQPPPPSTVTRKRRPAAHTNPSPPFTASTNAKPLRGGGAVLARKLIDSIQNVRAPVTIARAVARRRPDLVEEEEDNIYIIQGLDRVLLGHSSCAESVVVFGYKPPRYLFYMVSGFVCDILQLTTNAVLYYGFKLQKSAVCWAIGFCISIPMRHTSHRYLVFGDYVGGYWRSLSRMYAGYSVIIVLSTLFNHVMSRLMLFANMPVLWGLTMAWTGVVNYFILKHFWSFGGSAASTTSHQP